MIVSGNVSDSEEDDEEDDNVGEEDRDTEQPNSYYPEETDYSSQQYQVYSQLTSLCVIKCNCLCNDWFNSLC